MYRDACPVLLPLFVRGLDCLFKIRQHDLCGGLRCSVGEDKLRSSVVAVVAGQDTGSDSVLVLLAFTTFVFSTAKNKNGFDYIMKMRELN